MISEICIIIVLIVFNGLLSAAEIAILSSKKPKLQVDARNNKTAATAALQLKDNPNRLLLTIQIGLTLSGIVVGILSGGQIHHALTAVIQTHTPFATYSYSIAIIIIVLLVSYIMLVVGELVPKRMGLSSPELYAKTMAGPVTALGWLFSPLAWLAKTTANSVAKLFDINTAKKTVTEEEIKALMDEGVNSGTIEHIEHDLVDRILQLGDKKAINLMVHRSKITYLDMSNSFAENKSFILDTPHTEYPVCDGSFDNVKGTVHVKAVIEDYLNDREPNLQQLMNPIPFVHENSLAYNVMEVLRKSDVSQAVVVDEYGSPQGIITMKDIVGALFGRLEEVEDGRHRTIREREDGSYSVDGSYQLEEFFDYFAIRLSADEQEELGSITTIAGLVFRLLDRVPQEGEVVSYKNLHFEVIDMDAHRIDKLAVNLIDASSLNQGQAEDFETD